MSSRLVIVGGGQAAVQTIVSLRQLGFDGPVTLICGEPLLPYQRPPLSKKYLAGELGAERLLLKPEHFYVERGVTTVTAHATELDTTHRRVLLDDGRALDYDWLVLATGSRVRRLDVPGADHAGIHYLRTVADADAIQRDLTPGARVVLVGAGYIGLEVAAVAKSRGHAVTVLEAADRVMSRVVSEPVSRFYEREHRAGGVDLHCGAIVRAFHGTDRVRSVEIDGGVHFDCDLAIVGIGIEPNVELARDAGLSCGNGVVVDAYARTSDERVLAAGDCTEHTLCGRRVRLESVANAIQQGKCAASCVVGTPTPYAEVPWFWSDQYDLKLQIAGLPGAHERVVVRGDPAARSFAAYYVTADGVVSVEAVNSPRDFLAARKLIGSGARVDLGQLMDPATDVSALAR